MVLFYNLRWYVMKRFTKVICAGAIAAAATSVGALPASAAPVTTVQPPLTQRPFTQEVLPLLDNYDPTTGCIIETDASNNSSYISNLCRATDPSDPSIIVLYEHDKGPDSWIQAYSVKADGYMYWRSPKTAWFRQPVAGGATEVYMSQTSGQPIFVDSNTWMMSTPAAYSESAGYDIEQDAAMMLVDMAVRQHMKPAPGENESQTPVQPVPEQAPAPSDSDNNWDQDDVKLWWMEWNNRLARIWTQPSCNHSYNGCF